MTDDDQSGKVPTTSEPNSEVDNKSDLSALTNPSSGNNSTRSPIPAAVIVEKNNSLFELIGASYMWLLAIICLITALGVAWWSRPERGIHITIRFPEGHGLQEEDVVRFRGIDVGIVRDVKLNQELNGVDVTVNLFPAAEPIAREGSRFWIVRPELSLGGISGLETAVGHKYIGVIPGDPNGSWVDTFEGLSNSPPDAIENQGIEIILRGEKRHSITPDSPVMYRGVVVGRVLSVELSRDGRYVDTRLKIFEKYSMFVSSKSKFWPASGLDMEVSFTSGMKLNTESLETLLRGGISTLTPEAGGKPIQPGQVYTLFDRPEEDWFEAARTVEATHVELRGAVSMQSKWSTKTFLITNSQSSSFIGTMIKTNNNEILVPTDVVQVPPDSITGSFRLELNSAESLPVEVPDLATDDSKLRLLPVDVDPGVGFFSKSDIRDPKEAERCLAVRSMSAADKDTEYFHYTIEAAEIGDQWKLNHFNGDRSVWHGAPVLSSFDGKLIGILLVEETEAHIERIPESLFKQ